MRRGADNTRCAVGAFYNLGQVCLSVQHIYTDRMISEPFAVQFVQANKRLVAGDPLDERVDDGPMIDQREAERIEGWVAEAQA